MTGKFDVMVADQFATHAFAKIYHQIAVFTYISMPPLIRKSYYVQYGSRWSHPITITSVRSETQSFIDSKANDLNARYVKRLEERIHELESSHGQISDRPADQANTVAPLSHPTEFSSIEHHDSLPSNHRLPLQEGFLERISLANRELDNISPQFANSTHNQFETAVSTSKSENDEAQSNDSPAYLGSSSAVGFMAEVYQTFGSVDNTASKGSEGSVSTPSRLPPASWLAFSRSEPASLVSLASEFMIPPKSTADRLVESYWTGAHPLQPVISRRTFVRR